VKRKLTIRTKLAATLAVPLAALASFAALQVRDAYNQSDQVKLQAGLATSATGPAGALTALENERDYEALRAIGEQNLVAAGDTKFSAQVTARTDVALGNFRLLLGELGGDAAANYRSTLSAASAQLVKLRQAAENSASKTSSAANAKQAGVIFDEYTTLIGHLLDADQRSSATIGNAELRSGAELLNAISRQTATESGVGIKVGLAAITHDGRAIADAQRLADQQAEGDADLRVRADGAFEKAIIGALDATARKKAVAQLQAAAHNPAGANLVALLKTRPDSINLLRVAQTNTAAIVTTQVNSLTSAARGDERDWLALTVASILLAVALLWLTSRWITRPLRALANQATTMAGERLPAAVQQILATPVDQPVVEPELEPVQVSAGGEVYDVEVALNNVQHSAVALAVEQATLRRNVADAYVNLGRRNQNLLSRQLEFITQLENEEKNPETLEHLFRLDHLATRMRRNAESLLVLAGLAPPRTWSAPVAMGDVVRGALGEVEGYRRVRLRHIDDARVDGAAAADVSHVIAELVENALSFSPPDADVEVYGRKDDNGYVVTIIDNGIGMHEDELERANALISSANALTLAPSRFLGHYVVAQLAARHSLTVHLASSPAGGLTAMVALPTSLLGMKSTPVAEPGSTPPTAGPPSGGDATRPPAALPRRGSVADASLPTASAPATPVAPATGAAAAAISFRAASSAPAPEARLAEDSLESAAEADLIDEAEAFDDIQVIGPREVDHSGPSAPPERPAPAASPPPAASPASGAPAAPRTGPPVANPAATTAPAPPVETSPEAAPAPARPRLGLGSFADLRGAASSPVPAEASPAGTDAPDAAPSTPVPAATGAPAAPSASADRAPLAADRRASFAEVAQAVDVATSRPAPAESAGSPFAEDLIPQRLPKRGRRNSRLETPWVRQRPVESGAPVATPVSPAAPADSASVAPSPEAPGGPSVASASAPTAAGVNEPETNSAGSADSGERFAFFAAFRAAAEQAREEAGIDDRRGQ